MAKGRRAHNSHGFTIVELLIVIVVIGILAAIVIVGFTGIQQRATESAAKSSLESAAKAMEVAKVSNGGAYPTTLPPGVHSTNGITLALVASSLPYYSNVTPVQTGVLLSQICENLVAEGFGRGLNQGGNTDNYITGCGNWNAGSMQVTGWTSRVFNTPVTATTFSDYAATVPAGDSYHPNQQSVVRNFYLQMQSRLVAQGGSFPVTTFWDSWANSSNGGVMHQALPAPSDSGSTYCIQATTPSGDAWSIRPNGKAASGSC